MHNFILNPRQSLDDLVPRLEPGNEIQRQILWKK
jgi:hypothetical protein